MLYFKKLFKFPTPTELGMSDNDYAMPSELFRNNSTEYTWEQYYDRLKTDYPVRYFFASTLPQFFRDEWRDIKRPFTDSIYWFKCNFIPKHKYHLVDIRKATRYDDLDRGIGYQYGYMDTDWRMVYALFSLLVEFVEIEGSVKERYFCPSEEDAAKDDGTNCEYGGYKAQRERYLEFMAIYNYWIKERSGELAKISELTRDWSESRQKFKGDKNEETEKLWKELQAAKDASDARLEDMLVRLIKVRHCLWT